MSKKKKVETASKKDVEETTVDIEKFKLGTE